MRAHQSQAFYYRGRDNFSLGIRYFLCQQVQFNYFSRKKSKTRNEHTVHLYFVSLQRETETQKVVELPYLNVVYKVQLLFLYVDS